MPEGSLHRALKRAACGWLIERGYAAVADEVPVPGVGVIDVVGVGRWRRPTRRHVVFDRQPTVDRHHVVFIECKAMRSDFLHDLGRQGQFAFALSERADAGRRGRRRSRHRHASAALGKFDTCLLRPHAHVHYLCAPPGLLRVREVPRRWGLLVVDGRHCRVVRKSAWQEAPDVSGMEGAVARRLTTERMADWGVDRVTAPLVDRTPARVSWYRVGTASSNTRGEPGAVR